MNTLVRKGYLVRERENRDRRVIRVLLTEKGAEASRVHTQFYGRVVHRVCSRLNEEESQVLVQCLRQLDELFDSLKRPGKTGVSEKKGRFLTMSVQILTDSTSDILPEEAEQKGVRVVPLLVNFGEEAFRENVEITHQEYFRRLAQAESLPTTSQPTPQDFLAHFEQVQDAGDSLVCVLLASKLSGTFQSAQLAKELSGYDEIYIVDSQQALCGLRMLVDFACVLRDEGLSAREIAEQVESASHRVRLFGIVNTLEYLHKGDACPPPWRWWGRC